MALTMLAETEPDDSELVALSRGGDRVAFARLVARHYDFVRRVAWRACGSAADADDIAQEVCVRLAGAIAAFRGEGRFTTWLYTLALNAARDHARKGRRDGARRDAYAIEAGLAAGAGADAEAESARLWEAVRQLPAKQCEAVLLVYGEGLSHEAASDVMGCAANTVSWHIHEAKKRLKALLRPAGEG